MRWNGGGNTLLSQQLLRRLIASKRLSRRGALFVIIGGLTFSAAQNTVTAIERETSAIFVGEPTGSRPNFIGERIDFELPYSKVRANAADLYWQTSWPTDYRTWTAPDIYAPPTFEAFRRNQDPALDAILAIREYVPGEVRPDTSRPSPGNPLDLALPVTLHDRERTCPHFGINSSRS